MDGACPLSAAEQARQEKQRRMKHGKAGECQKHEADGGDPVIEARAAGIAMHPDRLAGLYAVTAFDILEIGPAHELFSPVSFSACSSSCSVTTFGPLKI